MNTNNITTTPKKMIIVKLRKRNKEDKSQITKEVKTNIQGWELEVKDALPRLCFSSTLFSNPFISFHLLLLLEFFFFLSYYYLEFLFLFSLSFSFSLSVLLYIPYILHSIRPRFILFEKTNRTIDLSIAMISESSVDTTAHKRTRTHTHTHTHTHTPTQTYIQTQTDR